MKTEKRGILLSVLITILVLLILFAVVLLFFDRKGYLSFNKESCGNCGDTMVTKTNNTQENSVTNAAKTNMTTEEVFDFWNKVKGNWANIQINDGLCVGHSLEINTYVQFAKFNSDGITRYGITSFNKIDEKTVEIGLVSPVNLNNQMNGGIEAFYNTLTIDMGEPNDGKMNIKISNGTWAEFEYVGDNKLIVNESTNYHYIDDGFSQDEYCNWYKKNH